MRSRTRIALAALMIMALLTPAAGSGAAFFIDVPGSHAFRSDIGWLSDAGITNGCNPPTNNRFCPSDDVTRGQMAAFLTRALGLTDNGGGNHFVDDDGSPFESDIARAAAAGITKGCNPPANDRFCPDAKVTRGQMAAFLHRALAPDDVIDPGVDPPDEPKGDRFWQWGWGLYNWGWDTTDQRVSVEAQAAFDWSMISFGNVPTDQWVLNRLNDVLEINPDHKFMIRVWPLLGLGNAEPPGTMLQYLYEPGVRDAILDEIWHQITYILDGISRPENVVGVTYLEELPLHFTSAHNVLGWERGESVPWDVAMYEDEINADLGGQFDMGIESHRLWWGQQYAETLAEIHQAMDQASGGVDVFYWQQTAFRTLDMLGSGESMFQDDVIPVYYEDIIEPNRVDGIFGYPNNDAIWQEKTTEIAEAFDISYWSQLSTPGFMRMLSWEDTVEIATSSHPNNLGVMIYVQPGTESGVWNRMPYMDGSSYWVVEEQIQEIINRYLK